MEKLKVWIDENGEEKGIYDIAEMYFDDDATYIKPVSKNWSTPNGTLLYPIGLKDVNKKMIYTGDIIIVTGFQMPNENRPPELKGFVEIKNGAVWVNNNGDRIILQSIKINTIEIIGNIYQDKDLLNEKKEYSKEDEIWDSMMKFKHRCDGCKHKKSMFAAPGKCSSCCNYSANNVGNKNYYEAK